MRVREGECGMLESNLSETKRKSLVEKDLLKRAAKQHKERAVESTQAVATLSTQLELAVSYNNYSFSTKDYCIFVH